MLAVKKVGASQGREWYGYGASAESSQAPYDERRAFDVLAHAPPTSAAAPANLHRGGLVGVELERAFAHVVGGVERSQAGSPRVWLHA